MKSAADMTAKTSANVFGQEEPNKKPAGHYMTPGNETRNLQDRPSSSKYVNTPKQNQEISQPITKSDRLAQLVHNVYTPLVQEKIEQS